MASDQDQHQNPPEEQLRTSFLSSSDDLIEPSPVEALTSWFTPRRIISWAILLATLGISWMCFFGPGAPMLERYLRERAEVVPSKTSSFMPSSTPRPSPSHTATPDIIQASPTRTIVKSPTPTPVNLAPTSTYTAEVVLPATDTLAPTHTESPLPLLTPTKSPTATATPTTAIANCTQALQVTLTDVGRTMCVTGNVLRTDDRGTYFLIILEDPANAFFFVSYDRKWENLSIGECVYATGEIEALGSVPIMEIGYVPPLEYCYP